MGAAGACQERAGVWHVLTPRVCANLKQKKITKIKEKYFQISYTSPTCLHLAFVTVGPLGTCAMVACAAGRVTWRAHGIDDEASGGGYFVMRAEFCANCK